ncbi:MAG: PIG-L family deacetylase [Elusimicrobia bacterium]|nr:PIG-L family deacetylase [Elusimicrobiota bacterium]
MKITSSDRVLIVAPHPDDEILSSFGLMRNACRAGAGVKVVFLTNGERNHLSHMLSKKKIFISPRAKAGYGRERLQEALLALDYTGRVESEFWGVADTGVPAELSKPGLMVRFRKMLAEFRPTIIVSPSMNDLHPDHSAAAVMTEMAVAGIPGNERRPLTLFYALHRRGPEPAAEFDLKLPLAPHETAEKMAFKNIYRTQASTWRRLAAKVAREEAFLTAEKNLSPHITVDFAGQDLVWLRTTLGSSIRPVRLTALYCDGKTCVRASLKLNWKKTSGPLREAGTGRTLALARLQKSFGRKGGLIALPAEISAGSRLLAVKAGGLFGFFDIAGFVKIPSAPPKKKPRTCAIIPCYNIDNLCVQAVSRAMNYADRVIAVDDGSTDMTAAHFRELERKGGNLTVISFSKNRGKGFAILEGMKSALAGDFDLILTMDGDLQHLPEDIPSFQRAWSEGGEFIIGYRRFSGKVPLRSRIGNSLVNKLVRVLFNRVPIDSQSGFRGFSRALAGDIVRSPAVRGGRYETEIDIMVEAVRRNYRVMQVEIPTIYLDGNRKSHFRPFTDSFRVVKSFVLNMARR